MPVFSPLAHWPFPFPPKEVKGEYSSLLVKEDDGWKIHRDIIFATRHAPLGDDMADDAM